jgi:hypothetical protein
MRGRLFILSLALLQLAFGVLSLSGKTEISGVIVGGAKTGGHIRVMVHNAGDLRAHESVPPVFPAIRHATNGSPAFSIRGLREGDYVLEVCGSSRLDYPHVRIYVRNDSIFSQEARRYPRLIHPFDTKKAANFVTFDANGPTAFGAVASQWSLLPILSNPMTVLQLAIGVALLGIPRLLARLESTLVAEIEGELLQKDNPNKILTCLLT